MKQLLFKSTVVVVGSIISVNTSIGNAIVAVIAFIFNAISEVFRVSGKWLMNRIDSERLKYIETTKDQYSELTELNLLMQVNHVKEDALRSRVWTVMHTIAMNKIGTALHNDCGWEPARIHCYLKQVIESIPGMVYSAGDEYEDQ